MGLVLVGSLTNLDCTTWKRAVSQELLLLAISIGIGSALVAGSIAFATRLL